MSLISVFNKTCANELSKYGFQKLKGLACFGRIINNEIFQYVMPVNRKSLEKKKKPLQLYQVFLLFIVLLSIKGYLKTMENILLILSLWIVCRIMI